MSLAEQGVAPHDIEAALPAASDSPLGRLRKAATARKQATTTVLDVPSDLQLVATVGLIADGADAERAMRMTMAFVTDGIVRHEDQTDEAAAVIAAAVQSLHYRRQDGSLEDILDEHGVPLRFDNRYGPAIGVPDIASGVDAVRSVFTVGDDPPTLDAVGLVAFGNAIAMWAIGESGSADLVPGS